MAAVYQLDIGVTVTMTVVTTLTRETAVSMEFLLRLIRQALAFRAGAPALVLHIIVFDERSIYSLEVKRQSLFLYENVSFP